MMAPAFSSPRQAGAFAALLLVILLLPVLVGKSLLPPRERIYSAAPWSAGAYPYLHEQIFREKGDIDIAFIGASAEYLAIDTPEVQRQLSAKLGRKAIVRSLCWYWAGFDAVYFITEDLLRNRKVHLLVFADAPLDDGPHPQAFRWFRFGDNQDALSGLSPQTAAAFYAEAVLGSPNNLLALFEPEQPVYPFSYEQLSRHGTLHSENPSNRLGSLAAERGFDGQPFAEFNPAGQASPADVCFYSSATKENFLSANLAMPQMQLRFAQKLADLANRNGTKLVFLSLPIIELARSPSVVVPGFWPDLLQRDVAIFGVPQAALFRNISDNDIPKLFFDHVHLNKNGQRYFTSIFAPALVDYYAQSNH
jgi:hypothetical protein